MITMWKQDGNGLVKTAILEKNCLIQVINPNDLEIETLRREYGISAELIDDILDIDERSRREQEKGYHAIILRIPVSNPEDEIPYHTVPMGIILLPEVILTICLQESEIFSNKNIDLSDRPGFVLQVILKSTIYYTRYLKQINRITRGIEKELQKSIRNHELIRLLDIEKSLVYFTTSLKSNELLIEKLQKTIFSEINGADSDLLEDVVTDNKQAIEMANIYSNILSGLMDAFASVISNNLNVVMKRLTSISLILMFPTLIASIYGMNISLPFQQSPLAFLGVVVGSVGVCILGIVFFISKRYF